MATGRDIIENKIAKRLRENPDSARDIGVMIAVELTGDDGGRWILDCTVEPAVVREDTSTKVETTIAMSPENLVKLSEGNLNAISAFMFGKIKIDGDLSVVTKLGKILS